MSTCCGGPSKRVGNCCGGSGSDSRPDTDCCGQSKPEANGQTESNHKAENSCCGGKAAPAISEQTADNLKSGFSCCGGQSKTETSCCGDTQSNHKPETSGCCGQTPAPAQKSCCGGKAKQYRQIAVTGSIETPAGKIPVVGTDWRFCDYVGALMVRSDIRRMDYAIAPGLYAVGVPDKNSPVLVSANYKLSFDVLRSAIAGLNAWLLILDTKGINVWCAAGKGTFGTGELINRVRLTRLAEVVDGHNLILPQLGAPGVSAHRVEAACGFRVHYAPVRASDVKAYIAAGMKAEPAMRRVNFGAADRLIVAWLEFVAAFGKAVLLSIGIVAVNAVFTSHPALAWQRSMLPVLLVWSALVSGTLLTGLLLPVLPGRAFSIKGAVMGALAAVAVTLAAGASVMALSSVGMIVCSTAISAYLALNYTGASTFTSLSGVKKELRYALPCIGALFGAGALLWAISGVLK